MQYTNELDSIQTVVQIDKNARQKVSDAQKEAEDILKNAEDKKQEMFESYRLRAETRLSKVQEAYDEQAKEEIAEIEHRKLAAYAELDEKMNKNKEKWENQIFLSITGK